MAWALLTIRLCHLAAKTTGLEQEVAHLPSPRSRTPRPSPPPTLTAAPLQIVKFLPGNSTAPRVDCAFLVSDPQATAVLFGLETPWETLIRFPLKTSQRSPNKPDIWMAGTFTLSGFYRRDENPVRKTSTCDCFASKKHLRQCIPTDFRLSVAIWKTQCTSTTLFCPFVCLFTKRC